MTPEMWVELIGGVFALMSVFLLFSFLLGITIVIWRFILGYD
jgi:hypothetical protein